MDQSHPPRWYAVRYGAVFAGAALMVIVPFLPIASLPWLDDERLVVRPGFSGGWRLLVLCGLAAAVAAALALARRRPLWTAWAALPGLVCTVLAVHYAFVQLPGLGGPGGTAKMEWGGAVWLAAGPLVLAGAVTFLMRPSLMRPSRSS